jgi:methionyl-tRNA formyltransferase
LKIAVLCSDATHPVNDHLKSWLDQISKQHTAELIRSRAELTEGDFLFLVSCSEIINAEYRAGYKHTLVLHASDLPRGRGWSPHIWEIVNGADHVILSLLEAEDRVDSGRIWLKRRIPISKDALWNEVNDLLFTAEVELINEAIENYKEIVPHPQSDDIEATYYPKRTPSDSEIDPSKSIEEQFNLIRICDPDRYPATFELHAARYKIILEKLTND